MAPDRSSPGVLVTGSSRGIGRAIARRLRAEGYRVVLNGRNSAALAEAAAEMPGTFAVAGDTTDPDIAKRVVNEAASRLGGLDALVCNVGSGRSVPPGQEHAAEWQRVLALNLFSATNTVEAAYPALKASRGAVVCISSICGVEVIEGAPVTYSAAKAALNAFVRGVARPFGRAGVRINAIAPGNILFDGSVWDTRLRTDPTAVQQMLDLEVPVGRLGTPDDIANLTRFLLSPEADFVTGRVWSLDGGQTHN